VTGCPHTQASWTVALHSLIYTKMYVLLRLATARAHSSLILSLRLQPGCPPPPTLPPPCTLLVPSIAAVCPCWCHCCGKGLCTSPVQQRPLLSPAVPESMRPAGQGSEGKGSARESRWVCCSRNNCYWRHCATRGRTTRGC
jgi:hypothetical protein